MEPPAFTMRENQNTDRKTYCTKRSNTSGIYMKGDLNNNQMEILHVPSET